MIFASVPKYFNETGTSGTGAERFPCRAVHRMLTFDISNNTFNINYAQGLGIWDDWRYEHPDNPAWMKIRCENNTFNILKDWPTVWVTYATKDAIFSKNLITGDDLHGWMGHLGCYWIPPEDPNYLLTWSENCKFLDNHFVANVHFYLEYNTQNYLIQGDLSKVTFEDYGVNNRVIGLMNHGHMDAAFAKDIRSRLECNHEMYIRQHKHN